MDNNIPPAPHVWPEGFNPDTQNHPPNIAQVPPEPNIWPPGVAVQNNQINHPPQQCHAPAQEHHKTRIFHILLISIFMAGVFSAIYLIFFNSNSTSPGTASVFNDSSSYSNSDRPTYSQGNYDYPMRTSPSENRDYSGNGNISGKIDKLINSIDNFLDKR